MEFVCNRGLIKPVIFSRDFASENKAIEIGRPALFSRMQRNNQRIGYTILFILFTELMLVRNPHDVLLT
jgi:hypothetical protein